MTHKDWRVIKPQHNPCVQVHIFIYIWQKLQYRQMGFLGDRFLGDLKWKGKKGKKDEAVTAEVVDKSLREPALDSADMVVRETAPVKKRQYVF